jgi:hypothetical protein
LAHYPNIRHYDVSGLWPFSKKPYTYSRIPTSLGALCLSALRVLGTPLGRSAQTSARASMSQFILQVRALLGPLSSSTLFLYLQVRARTFGPRPDLCPCPRYDPNPCHPTPLGCPLGCLLGHLCLAPSYEFEPVPSGPTRTSIIVRVMSAAWIRTARNKVLIYMKAILLEDS